MLTLKCCQDHILTENIWFVWSETSYSGDERRCYRCGTNNNQRTVKIELLSQWKLEAEFRNIEFSSPEKSGLAHVEVGHLAQHLGVLHLVIPDDLGALIN